MKIDSKVKYAVRHKYAWPGGYPMFILCDDGGSLCPQCAKDNWGQIAHDTVKGWAGTGWNAVGAGINYEDRNMICDHCGNQIESAY